MEETSASFRRTQKKARVNEAADRAARERGGAGQGWRGEILQEFLPGVARLTLAADPDGLLFDPELLAALENRGFDVLPFDDPIASASRTKPGTASGLMAAIRRILSSRCGAARRICAPFPVTSCGRGGGWCSVSPTCSRA